MEERMIKFFWQKKIVEPEPIVQETNQTDYKAMCKNLKKELEKLQKLMQLQKKEEKEETSLHTELEAELNEKKKKMFEVSKELKEQKEKMDKLEKLYSNEREKTENLQKELDRVKKEKENISSTINKMKNRQIAAVKNKDDAEENAKRTVGILKKQNQEIKKYEYTIHMKNEKIRELEEELDKFITMNPKHLIKRLESLLSKETAYDFQPLTNLYKRYVNIRAWMKLNRLNKQYIIEEKTEYGFLVKNRILSNDKWYFTTTDSRSFEVVGYSTKSLEIGIPVSAIVDETNDTAIVVWSYETEEEMHKERKENVHKKPIKHTQKSMEDYEYIGPISVLLVTSKNGIRYRDRLKKHGVMVEWMDPYEKSIVHIRNKANSFDMVLLLEDAMPHDARTLIEEFKNEDSDKVQTMYHHKEETVVARVRYIAYKKGMIKVPLLKVEA